MSADAYRQKVEAKLDEYQAKLDGARAKLKGATADARLDAEKQIDDLQSKLAVAKAKAAELADAGEDAWSNVTKDLDDKFSGFTSAVKGFFSSSD
jgi:DNA repair exonuclease SbcCD ATPase subunit